MFVQWVVIEETTVTNNLYCHMGWKNERRTEVLIGDLVPERTQISLQCWIVPKMTPYE